MWNALRTMTILFMSSALVVACAGEDTPGGETDCNGDSHARDGVHSYVHDVPRLREIRSFRRMMPTTIEDARARGDWRSRRCGWPQLSSRRASGARWMFYVAASPSASCGRRSCASLSGTGA